MGPVADQIFWVLLIFHLIANVAAISAGLVVFLVSPGSIIHIKFGRIFVYSLALTILAGMGMVFIRTATQGLLGSQGFSGAVNMYFLFVGACGLDFLVQGALVSKYGWGRNLRLIALLPFCNLVLGVMIYIWFGILPQIVTDPETWLKFEPIVALFSPIYMLFEATNLWVSITGYPGWGPGNFLAHHRRNMLACLAIVLSILLGDICINRFWNVAVILSGVGGLRLVLITVFFLPHILPLKAWLSTSVSTYSVSGTIHGHRTYGATLTDTVTTHGATSTSALAMDSRSRDREV
ncbi:hypothetical protein AAMO2058_000711600 [Amorphochlora amoebiformis]